MGKSMQLTMHKRHRLVKSSSTESSRLWICIYRGVERSIDYYSALRDSLTANNFINTTRGIRIFLIVCYIMH